MATIQSQEFSSRKRQSNELKTHGISYKSTTASEFDNEHFYFKISPGWWCARRGLEGVEVVLSGGEDGWRW